MNLNQIKYLATASLYTKPAVALRTISKQISDPSILKINKILHTFYNITLVT